MITFVILALIYPSYQKVFVEDYSLTQPYNSHFSRSQGWTTLGSAVASHDKIILTTDSPGQKGSIWLMKPINIRNWKIIIDFKIHGDGTSFYGDGFALWYINNPSKSGTVFGNHDYFNGLGIMFDTYSNHRDMHKHLHPYISAQINDGTVHYDHDSDGTHTQLNGCSYDFRGRDTIAEIAYYGSNETLLISLRPAENLLDSFHCFTSVSVELPTGYYLGLSAATGDLSDNHEIHSVKFFNMDEIFKATYHPNDYSHIIPRARYAEPQREHATGPPASTTSWRMFKRAALIVFVFGLTSLILLLIFAYLNKRKKDRMKRFY